MSFPDGRARVRAEGILAPRPSHTSPTRTSPRIPRNPYATASSGLQKKGPVGAVTSAVTSGGTTAVARGGGAPPPRDNAVEVKKAATFGWAAKISVTGAAATAEADGKYGVNVDLASVVLDKDGKVLNATWDVAQASNLKFDVLGALKADPASYTKTKMEKGADYGMKANSGIGKEWNEQSAFMSTYIVGKTAADIEAIELVEGDATDSEILAGATITLSSWQAVTLKAIDAAVDFTK